MKTKILIAILALTLVFSGLFIPVAPAKAANVSSFVCTGTIMNKVAGAILGKIAGTFLGGLVGGNEVPTKDSKARDELSTSNKYQDLIDCAQETLTNLNHDYVGNFINGVLQNYTISNYLNYTRNLAYKVYVADLLVSKDPETEFIIRKNIQHMMDTSIEVSDLKAVYQRRSLSAAKIKISSFKDVVSSDALDGLDDPYTSTPMGQKFAAVNEAQIVYGQAETAASASVANGQGKKDAYSCNVDKTTLKTLCVVKYPGQYVTSQLDSRIAGLFGEQVKPQRNVAALTTFIKKFTSLGLNKIGNEILSLVRNPQSTAKDTKVETGPGATAPPSALPPIPSGIY